MPHLTDREVLDRLPLTKEQRVRLYTVLAKGENAECKSALTVGHDADDPPTSPHLRPRQAPLVAKR